MDPWHIEKQLNQCKTEEIMAKHWLFLSLARKVNDGASYCRLEYRNSKGCHNSIAGTQHVYVYRKVASTFTELLRPNWKNHKIYAIALEGPEEEAAASGQETQKHIVKLLWRNFTTTESLDNNTTWLEHNKILVMFLEETSGCLLQLLANHCCFYLLWASHSV